MNTRGIITLLATLTFTLGGFAKSLNTNTITVENLTADGRVNPMETATAKPSLAWQINAPTARQTAVRLIVASSLANAQQMIGDLCDTTLAPYNINKITYPGRQLKANTRCFWRVCITTDDDRHAWSNVGTFNVPLLAESDWSGQWIGYDHASPTDREDELSELSARYLRTTFQTRKNIAQATLYISGVGLYEAYINGQNVAQQAQVLQPAPTDYRRTVLYNTYDVTSLIGADNCLAVLLSNGRFYTMQQNKKPYKIVNFGYPRLRANLIIDYEDGTRERVTTTNSWRLSTDGAIRSANEYDGEIYDARMSLGDWTSASYDDGTWACAERVAAPFGVLRSQCMTGMAVTGVVSAVSVTRVGSGYVVDFGENMAGWVRLKNICAASGDTIRFVYSEAVNADGTLKRENLRHALSRDIYVADGRRGQEYAPRFTYHGFRYVEVQGLETLDIKDITAEHVGDAMEQTGRFSCSDETLNAVFRNAVRGIRANYKGMPVDCPQRDERQPWLGDRTMGSTGESWVFDNRALYVKWMRDIADSQREDGVIPDVAPAFWNYYSDNVTWPAALPFTLAMLADRYEDLTTFTDYYDNVERWLRHIKERYWREGIVSCDKYGDWCFVPEDPARIHGVDTTLMTDGRLIATAYYAMVCKTVARLCSMVGKSSDARRYEGEARTSADAFVREFLTVNKATAKVDGHPLYPDSTYFGNNTLTANLLGYQVAKLSTSADTAYIREQAGKQILKRILLDDKEHLSCGVIGVSWLMRTLAEMGRNDVAWRLATQDTYPSWGYMVAEGATTIWELWNGDKAPFKMNSANHVMLLGDLLSWIYQDIVGIKSIREGVVVLAPEFGVEEIDQIDASFKSIYGEVSVAFTKERNERVRIVVGVPGGCVAKLRMPDGSVMSLTSGRHEMVVSLPRRDERVVSNEFLYTKAAFPECHSATIVETKRGDLVATYFGGTKEANPDVCIWASIKKRGANSWSEPIFVADGIFELGTDEARIAGVDTSATKVDELHYRKACWNPVIFEQKSGELVIYFKIGRKVSDWTGWRVSSSDGGKTWKNRMPLDGREIIALIGDTVSERGGYSSAFARAQLLGPIKNKIVESDGRLIAPASKESAGWHVYFELSDDNGKTWRKSALVDGTEGGIEAIQPSVVKLADGRLEALCRTRNRRVAVSYSSDNGETWTPLRLLEVNNNNSGLDAVRLSDGSYVMVCNPHAIEKDKTKGSRTPLALLRSTDGEHWEHMLTLEDSVVSQYSYPSIIEGRNGSLHVIYTWRRRRIKHVEISLR